MLEKLRVDELANGCEPLFVLAEMGMALEFPRLRPQAWKV